jgi:hypothetical protein
VAALRLDPANEAARRLAPSPRLKGALRNRSLPRSVNVEMPNKLQQLRKEQLRGSRTRPRGRRLSDAAIRKETDKHFYGTLGPASPVKRIDPKTGEVIEILNPQQSNST